MILQRAESDCASSQRVKLPCSYHVFYYVVCQQPTANPRSKSQCQRITLTTGSMIGELLTTTIQLITLKLTCTGDQGNLARR